MSKELQAEQSLSSPNVVDIQAALVTQGAKIATDGKLGPETVAAIREFQRRLLKAPTGVLTAPQIATLFRNE
jgi:peptidoglycan hydrolase-like protein with peptidoglycan-binding domain